MGRNSEIRLISTFDENVGPLSITCATCGR